MPVFRMYCCRWTNGGIQELHFPFQVIDHKIKEQIYTMKRKNFANLTKIWPHNLHLLSIYKGTKAELMIHVSPMVMMGFHGAVQTSIHLLENILKHRSKHFVQTILVTLITAQLGSILSQIRKHAIRFFYRLLSYFIDIIQ